MSEGGGREPLLRLLYLYLAAVYAALAAYTVWSPFWGWAARYAAQRGAAGLAAAMSALPYLLAAASFVAVLAYAPALALAVTAFGAAAGGVAGATIWLPVVLALGSSLLYGLATRLEAEVVIPRRGLLGAAAVEAGALSVSAAAGLLAGPMLAGLAASAPPAWVPGLAARAWAALSSTMAGRLLVYGAAVAAVSWGARWLAGQLLLLASPRLAARWLGEGLRARLARGGPLVEAMRQASLLASLVYGAAAAYTVWALASTVAGAAASTTAKALVLGLAAGAAWVAYAASKRLVDYVLLGRPRWGLLAAVSGAALAALAAYTAATGGPGALLGVAHGAAGPLDGLHVEDRLLRLYETLEAQLRLLVSLIWG